MSSFKEYLADVWKNILDFLFPSSCVLCGGHAEIEGVLCKLCSDNLYMNFSAVGDIPEPLEFVFALAPFDESHRMLIHIFKYDGVVSAGRFLGRRLGECVAKNREIGEFDLLVPVPLHRERCRERGYNQAEVIAKCVSEISGIPYSADIVSRSRATKSQTKLSRSERIQNVAGAFEIKNPQMVMGKSIMIVDDVVTTGATVSEIARTLISAGASRVGAICISRPSHSDSQRWMV